MGDAVIEVSGLGAERLAGELRGVLVGELAGGGRVSPVEVRRSAELVIATVGLVFSGIEVAGTIWGWWQSRKETGVSARVLLEDGMIELSNVDLDQLELVLGQAAQRRSEPDR